ncbi:MAG: cell division protein SepF [Selenomonadaceae bacterium]|nr:cell division protein SepF [Selenomonadaceae bacterium]
MKFTEYFKKLTDLIMPYENSISDDEEEEATETKKTETKSSEPQPAQAQPLRQQPVQSSAQTFQAEKQTAAMGGMNQNFGTMNFTRNGGMVSTAENGVTSMGGYRYEAYSSDSASVRPSLAVVKTPSINVKIYAPTKYDEQVKSIGSDLMQHNALVVNYENVEESIQQRIGDFILGVVYANNGKVEMISSRIMLYVPDGFDVESAPTPAMRRY